MSLFTTFKGVFGAKNGGDATRAEVKPPPPIRKEKTYAAEKTLGELCLRT
ncbi:hypothetical protein M427DRAFT_35022 [Gonapodya prolifera JEL478]|uniref:Uncharacterized protein n=1 Tax=Gonapodya prolifera (strain JEL478) TaxID=1344416 RepID=A0A139A5V4_GONPJ|nr:hypothetical protein M427DRAFT_35022 [Gonapodya prolifera JEL478]|eukprot:KXS12134.1 hypothetical protein M427DRAFT_35022 [Gonapodya prolifera JEL478]